MKSTLSTAVLVLGALLGVRAHQEPSTPEEIEVQRNLQSAAYHCAPAIAEFTAQRQRAWAQAVLGGRPALPEWDTLFDEHDKKVNAPGREQKLLSCTTVDETVIRNQSCVLAPEVTEGPYYHTTGHPIRQNIAEDQIGLLLLLDVGVVDVETCKPVPNVLVDIWMANATGHYAGHPDPEPHFKDENPQVGGKRAGLLSPFPRTMSEETWLRGAWPTDRNGVAQFTSIFPGYYTGRATHVHTKVFTEWDVLPNNTFTSKKLAHVGQFFFDDRTNLQVDKMWPYITNPIRETRGRTRNWRDSLNIFEDSHGPEGQYNPVFDLYPLGSLITQGLVGYITMGVNISADHPNVWRG